MAWYAYYETATGRLNSVGESDIVPPPGLSKVYVGEERPTGIWNETTLQYDPRPPIRKIVKSRWLDRFTRAELIQLLSVDYTVSNPNIIALHRYILINDDMDLDDQVITGGMDAVVTAGLITPARLSLIMADA